MTADSVRPRLDGNSHDSSYDKNDALAGFIIGRQDPGFEELIAQTTFVSVYRFDDQGSEWSRANVEGFLFIIRRKCAPKYRLIVLNQKNQSNLIEDIDASWDLTTQMNYIFYRYHNEDRLVTRGLWFHDDVERKRIWQALSTTVELSEAGQRGDTSSSSSSSRGPQQQVVVVHQQQQQQQQPQQQQHSKSSPIVEQHCSGVVTQAMATDLLRKLLRSG